jgi:threonyl-tRNA synthetase
LFFRFENFIAQISLRDKENKEKYIEVMKTEERKLLSTLQQTRTKHSYRIREAAFLWSKVGFHGKRCFGRQWQLGTIHGL